MSNRSSIPRLAAALACGLAVSAASGGASAQSDEPPGADAAASAVAVEAPASSASAPARRPAVDAVLQTVSIPLRGVTLFGGDIAMSAQVFLPRGPGPFPVVVFSHGRSADRDAREALKVGVSLQQLRYWIGRGDAVVAPIRPGYGATGGTDFEGINVRFEGIGRCIGRPHFEDVATAASRTVTATLDWLKTQGWADREHVLLVGQSYGGFTTVAAAALRPAGVVGYINYAGGVGGNSKESPAHSCHPEQATELFAELGRTTAVPGLWMYAENDEFWGASVPVAWHDAFAGGGSRTTFVHAPPVDGGKGHGLSARAPRLWAPAVDAFLATIDFPATPAPSAAPAASASAPAP